MVKALKKYTQGIFFGWWIVLACNIMTLWGNSFYVYGFGAFFKPLSSEFGWSRAATAGASSLGKIEGGLEGIFAGFLTDKYGPRIICFIGSFIAGVGLILMSRINSLFSFYLFWSISSLGINLGLAGALYKAITDWFVKKRGLALSISKGGFALGGSILPLIITTFLFNHGWRKTFIIAGLITWVINLPLSWFLLKPHRPEYYGLLPDGAKTSIDVIEKTQILKNGEIYAKEIGEEEFSFKEASRTWSFWSTGIVFAIRGMVTGVVNVHTIPLLTDRGMDPIAAATAMGILVGLSLPGRIVGGILSDKVGIEKMKYLMMLGLGGIFISFLILLNSGSSILLLYFYIIIYGLIGLGFCSTITPIIKARYFGRKSFTTIHGTQQFLAAIAGIISPIYAGWVYDITNSYISVYYTLLIMVFISILLMFFADPPNK